MQQEIDEEPFKLSRKQQFEILMKFLPFWKQYRLHPEILDPFIDSIKGYGIPEKNLMMLALREAHFDNAPTYRADRYLVAGMGAIDLVLFSVVLPMGTSDSTLFIAVLFLAISFPLAGTSLLVSFIKETLGISFYGRVHSLLILLSIVSGFVAFAALFLHTSIIAGVMFIVLTILLFLGCTAYFFLLMLKAASTPDSAKEKE